MANEQFSIQLEADAKMNGIHPRQLVYAQLLNLGYSEEDAYRLVINQNVAKTTIMKIDIVNLRRNASLNKYIDGLSSSAEREDNQEQDTDAKSEEINTTDIDFMDKENIAKELLRSVHSLPVNDPKRADVLMKYADLMQMKKDEVKGEEKLVHFYFPIRCDMCNKYVKLKEESLDR